MRILYGVVGEGMGHATRSRVVMQHLLNSGHELEVVVSGRACEFLRRSFPALAVHGITGFNMIYKDNAVRAWRTALDALRKLPAFAENHKLFQAVRKTFRPEVTISDFESFAYLYGKQHRIPILSIDNMHVIDRCRMTVRIPPEERANFELTRTIVRTKLARSHHYLITSFFFPPIRKPRTSLYPPILRDLVLKARASLGDHVLVYQTSDSFRALLPTLRRLPVKFFVYGLRRGEEPEESIDNLTLKRFSEQGFVDDLASAKAVLAGGGFSLMGEAVYLGKPMLAVPVKGQFEQTLNALYLEKLGYGEYHSELSGDGVSQFLERAQGYAANLKQHHQDGNSALLGKLDQLLVELAHS